MRRFLLAVILLSCAVATAAQERGAPTTIILVRHAEKDTAKSDPALTARGRERARLLARIVAAAGIRSTHSTQYRRTEETVAPADSLLGLTNEVVAADPDSLPRYVRRLIDHLLAAHAGEATLVASHSNVIPMILEALGLGKVAIGEGDYDNLFVVTARQRGRATMVRLQMGMP